MGRIFLEISPCFASRVWHPTHVWALYLLRLLVVQLRHCLMVDGLSDCSLTIGIVLHKSHMAQSFLEC